MGRIITKGMVLEAIALVGPSADKILSTPGTTWGPQWVEGRVMAPGLEEVIKFDFGEPSSRLGEPNPFRSWKKEWGPEIYFGEIAEMKLRATEREMDNTSLVVATNPWNLELGEFLYGGGVYRDGICVGVSGAKEKTDEAIAEMVATAIAMLALLETERRIKEGENLI